MKVVFAAFLAVSCLGLPQQASAQTLMDIFCPKPKSDISAASHPKLDHRSTGSVAKDQAHAPAPETSSYPQAILWSLPYP